MVRRANRYFQNLKTKGILSVFRLAKGDYSSRERERALCKRQAAFSWNLLNLLVCALFRTGRFGTPQLPSRAAERRQVSPTLLQGLPGPTVPVYQVLASLDT